MLLQEVRAAWGQEQPLGARGGGGGGGGGGGHRPLGQGRVGHYSDYTQLFWTKNLCAREKPPIGLAIKFIKQ